MVSERVRGDGLALARRARGREEPEIGGAGVQRDTETDVPRTHQAVIRAG